MKINKFKHFFTPVILFLSLHSQNDLRRKVLESNEFLRNEYYLMTEFEDPKNYPIYLTPNNDCLLYLEQDNMLAIRGFDQRISYNLVRPFKESFLKTSLDGSTFLFHAKKGTKCRPQLYNIAQNTFDALPDEVTFLDSCFVDNSIFVIADRCHQKKIRVSLFKDNKLKKSIHEVTLSCDESIPLDCPFVNLSSLSHGKFVLQTKSLSFLYKIKNEKISLIKLINHDYPGQCIKFHPQLKFFIKTDGLPLVNSILDKENNSRIEFSQDGLYILIAKRCKNDRNEEKIFVFKIKNNGECVPKLREEATYALFSHDGKYLLMAKDNKIIRSKLDNNQITYETVFSVQRNSELLKKIALSSDGRYFIVWLKDSEIAVFQSYKCFNNEILFEFDTILRTNQPSLDNENFRESFSKLLNKVPRSALTYIAYKKSWPFRLISIIND